MILTVLGLPGSFTDLCRDACIEIARLSGRQVAAVSAESIHPEVDALRRDLDTLGSLAAGLLAHPVESAVVTSTTPDRSFCDTIRASDVPFLFAMDDPRLVALELITSKGLSAAVAARTLTSSCSCLTQAFGMPAGVQLRRSGLETDPEGSAKALLKLLRIEAGDDLIAGAIAILRRLSSDQGDASFSGDASHLLRERLPSESALTIEAALGSFNAFFNGQKLGPIIATRETFYSVDPVGEPLQREVDATGRARCLAYGPYFSIPAGSWMLRLLLAFSIELVDVPFSVDVLRSKKGNHVEAGKISFQAIAGQYVMQLAFANSDPEALVQFRVFLDRAVFDGRFSVGYAELTRSDPHPELDLSSSIEWQG